MKTILTFLLSIACMAAHLAEAQTETAPSREITIRSKIDRDISADISARITPMDWTLVIPEGSYLEYDVWIDPQNPNFGAGINIITSKGSITSQGLKDEKGVTSHFAGSAPALERVAKGTWYHRRFSLERLWNATASEIVIGGAAGYPKSMGENNVKYRNICLTDKNGNRIVDLAPRLGWLPTPLVVMEFYFPNVDILASDIVSGYFDPQFYLGSDSSPLAGDIVIRNLDPEKKAPASYELALVGLDKIASPKTTFKGEMELSPGEEKKIAVKFPPLPRGNYRPILTIQSGSEKANFSGYAITTLSKKELENRPQPFTKGSFGMGSVPFSGGGPIQTIPAIREYGANYFQLRLDWSQIEVAPGVYDTSRIQKYVSMAKKCGMWMEIDFYSGYQEYTVPKWYHDQQMLTNYGEKHGGPFTPIAYWTEARQAGLRAMQHLINQFKDEPTIIAWNAWQAGNMDAFYALKGNRAKKDELMDYSPSSQAKFREYVRDVLKLSINDINVRYGLKITSWEELNQPMPIFGELNLTAYWHDFINYRLWSVEHASEEASKMIRKLSTNSTVEYLYGGGVERMAFIGNDFDSGLRNALRYRGSLHHTASPGVQNQAYMGMATRHFGVPFSIETAGTPASPPQHQLAIFELLSQNASVFTFIRSPGVGLLPTPDPDQGFGEFRAALERTREARAIEPPIALIYSYSNSIIDIFNKVLNRSDLIQRFESVSYDFDLFTDRTTSVRWKEYPLVVDSLNAALDSRFVDEIVQYVQQGGKLLLFTSSGEYTPGKPDERFALLKKLGCDPTQAKPQVTMGKPKAHFVGNYLDNREFELKNFKQLGSIPKDAKVWAIDMAENPAVASWKVGKGEVLVWAGMPDWRITATKGAVLHAVDGGKLSLPPTAMPSVFDAVLKDFSGVAPSVENLTPDIFYSFKKKGSDYFLILFNSVEANRKATLKLPVTGKSLNAYHLAKRFALPKQTPQAGILDFSIDLAPLEVAVIQLSPSSITEPTYDSPYRERQVPPPEDAITASNLKNIATGSSINLQGKTLLISKEAILDLPLPAPGKYKVEFSFDDAPESSAILDTASGNVLFKAAEKFDKKFAVTDAFKTGSESYKIKIQNASSDPLKLRWIRIVPVFHSIGSIWMTPALDNTGPFPGPLYNKDLPEEKKYLEENFNPSASSGEWKSITLDTQGKIDLQQVTGQSMGLNFLSWTTEASAPKKILLGLGMDYGLRLWVNGKQVFDSTKSKRDAIGANEISLPVELKAGKNVFVAKVAAGSQGWAIWLNAND